VFTQGLKPHCSPRLQRRKHKPLYAIGQKKQKGGDKNDPRAVVRMGGEWYKPKD